jgi:hypothetical protein
MALGFPFPVLGSICEKKVALGGAADNNTFTIDFGTGQDATVHMVCLRDRHSAQNQVVSTAVSYSVDTDSPFTLETTAVTALARDDAVWLAAVVPQEVLTDQVWSINAPSQFSTRELVVSLSRQITSVLYTRDGLPAGDTGILSGIAALTAGAGVAQYVSQIASVPAGNSFVNASGLRW